MFRKNKLLLITIFAAALGIGCANNPISGVSTTESSTPAMSVSSVVENNIITEWDEEALEIIDQYLEGEDVPVPPITADFEIIENETQNNVSIIHVGGEDICDEYKLSLVEAGFTLLNSLESDYRIYLYGKAIDDDSCILVQFGYGFSNEHEEFVFYLTFGIAPISAMESGN